MASLFNWWRAKPVAPERIPTDIVIPLHSLDDTKTNQSMVLDFSMRFDDVLNVEKLAGALEQLLERPGWRKLGARLRMNQEGKLEYHIPAQYTTNRRAVNFSHVKHDVSISQHPIASQLLRPTGTLQVSPEIRPFRPLLVSENSPSELSHWIYTDRPQFSVHVVSFTDATLVTLTWLHTLLDAMGRNMLLRAWSAQLEGREKDIPEFYGYDFDPLASLGAPTDTKLKDEDASDEEEFVYQDKRLSGWKMFRFVFSFLWEILVYRKEEQHIVIIPASFFKSLKSGALNDLKSVHPATIVMDTSEPSNPKPFLSDGDVLCAWWTRLLISAQPWLPSAKPTKTVQIMNVFGMRNLLTDTEPQLLPRGVAYIGNCIAVIISFFSLSEFLSLPLGLVAARLRSDLVTQSSRAQINASVTLSKAGTKETGYAPIYGEPDMMFSGFSNWTKGKMFETDFKASVVREGTMKHVVGQPTYVQADGTTKGFSIRNSGPCLGRDSEGNWWVGSLLRSQTWRNIEKAIEGMK